MSFFRAFWGILIEILSAVSSTNRTDLDDGSHQETYVNLRGCNIAAEIIIRIFVHKDAISKIIQRRVLITLQYCPRKTEDVRSDLWRSARKILLV